MDHRLTTGTSPQYSMAAAVTLIISIIVISISMMHSRNYTHLIWRTSKMNNSIKLKRRLTQSLTYLYLIGLSIVIIYPLLITIMSAFKAGNVSAFKLDTNIDLNFDNFKGLFTETLYGTWYLNTLIIALITMAVQTSIIVLAGYAYSRYNFLARKQSLVFFLIVKWCQLWPL